MYAAIVGVDTRSQKFYEICKQSGEMKYPLMKKIIKAEEKFGEDSAECKLALNLMEIIEMCSLARDKKKIVDVCKEFTTKTRKLLNFAQGASGAADVLKNILKVKKFELDKFPA